MYRLGWLRPQSSASQLRHSGMAAHAVPGYHVRRELAVVLYAILTHVQ